MTAVYSIVRFALAERSLGLRRIQLRYARPDLRHAPFDVVFVCRKVPVGSDALLYLSAAAGRPVFGRGDTSGSVGDCHGTIFAVVRDG